MNSLKKHHKIIFFIMFFCFQFSYSQTLTGVVQDTLKKPLQNANVIAKPKQATGKIKFAIADYIGRYRLELDKETDYEISVSYIGHKEQTFHFETKNPVKTFDFTLKETGEVLKEVIITHKYEPIVVKKDTVSYTVSAFASGNERKLGDQLEKLPGVEVDKNGGVTFQGKKVNQLLLDDKPFFGGGTKLGVQNIPADAVDKAEFIDNFNEVGFLKEVSDSDQLALNIKLKKDKKKFVFGDLQAGYGLDNYYLGHASLFYYSPKINLSYIGDVNNFGQRVFTFDDLIRFQGGYSTFLSGRKNFGNLWNLSNDQTDVTRNKSYFHALNFNYEVTPKVDIDGYFMFSKILQNSLNQTNNTYLQTLIEEQRTENGTNKNQLFATNIKIDYNPEKNTKWFYNIYSEITNNITENFLKTNSNFQNTTFDNFSEADNYSLRQYIERHQKHNKKNTTTLVINHILEQNKPLQTWLTNQPFFVGLIPLENDNNYKIEKLRKTTQNNIDVMFKHYWTINARNHLYSIIGNQYVTNQYFTSEKQILSNNTINDFATNGFGNDVKYTLNDFYTGLEYKFRIKKWTNKPMIYAHFYRLNTLQNSVNQNFKPFYLEPKWHSEYEFNDAEKITFDYVLKNEFPAEHLVAENYTLQSFNTVFKGNALLKNERFHRFSLNYMKNNLFRGWMIFANAIYTNKVKNIRNSVVLDGINQFTTPILFDLPETNWMFNSNISKRIYKFNLSLNTSLNGFSFIQELNNVTARNDRNSQRIGLSLRTSNKDWPSVKIAYNHGFNQIKGIQNSDFQTQNFNATFDHEIIKHWILKSDYNWNKNIFDNRMDSFDNLDFSLAYQRKNNPWIFEFKVNNALNTPGKFTNNFSDFLISTQQIFILPRVALFSISYKL
jgi:hypothetical protein